MPVARAVGTVVSIWPQDLKFDRFQAYLSRHLADTPNLYDFRAHETWLTVRAPGAAPDLRAKAAAAAGSTAGAAPRPREFKVRSLPGSVVEVGDLVEVRVMDDARVRRYAELSAVTQQLCRHADADFGACAQRTPLGVWPAAAPPGPVLRSPR
ncbi:MAG: hypothetical protein AB9M60_17405 [Leptothrix sp. (in: b-proteobacteria)]